jgi:hypothetical protein
MPTTVTISGVTGATPFDIYLCDSPITTCIYINTVNSGSFPYNFNVPDILENITTYNLKVVDNNGCITTTNLTI